MGDTIDLKYWGESGSASHTGDAGQSLNLSTPYYTNLSSGCNNVWLSQRERIKVFKILWVPQVQELWTMLVIGLNSFFFSFSSSPVASPGTEGSRSNSQNYLSGPRRNPRKLMAPHPILKGRAVLVWCWWCYRPWCSIVCWDWIQATLGFWAWQNLVSLRW